MLKKNEIVTLEITGITGEGSGVGRADGIAVFVPFTAVGDVIECRIVKVMKSYCYGIIDRIVTPSADRCDSGCEVYGRCGGCSLRHMSYTSELAAKQLIVENAFGRIGGLSPSFDPIIGADEPERYRNKAQFPVAADENGRLFAGFYARRSHRTIRMTDCKLLPEVFGEICGDIIAFCNERGVTAYDETLHEGLLRHIFIRRGAHSGELMAGLIVTDSGCGEMFMPLGRQLAEKYDGFRSLLININPHRTNVILGEKTLPVFGEDRIYDFMCGRRIAVSLHSFYQINTRQAERVYSQAAEYAALTGNDTLLDLYCGAGTVGLSMADRAGRLIGAEIVPQAIENARLNAKLNGIENAEFICGDAGEAARLLYERGERPDVIIADPARKGCTRETLEYMAKMSPDRIVMISCNPATAARDCAVLSELGYRAVRCSPADLFPRTPHVESVILLVRERV